MIDAVDFVRVRWKEGNTYRYKTAFPSEAMEVAVRLVMNGTRCTLTPLDRNKRPLHGKTRKPTYIH